MTTNNATGKPAAGAPRVADIYALAPMQQGILFDALLAGDPNAYFNQFSCRLRGALDVDGLRRAWEHLAARHAVLRSSFHWEGLSSPVQVVHAEVELPWTYEDWRGRDGDTQARDWERVRADERHRGFALDRAPLLRLRLHRTGPDEYLFCWSHHHLLLDGWCLPILLRELLQAYGALRTGRNPGLPPVRPYRDYVEWLRRRPGEADHGYWRAALRGLTQPTPLGLGGEAPNNAGAALELGESESFLEAPLGEALRRAAERHHLAPSTLLLGTWALLLERYSGERDVLFGTTVSGRPAELEGAADMVGVFINTVPVRVRLDPDEPLLPWLKRLQAEQAERAQHGWAALADVQRASEVPSGTPLFDSMFVFQNYPAADALTTWPHGVTADQVHVWDQGRAPLLVQVTPGPRWQVLVTFDRRRFGADAIERLHGHLATLLEGMARDPERPLRAFEVLGAAEREHIVAELSGPERPFDPACGVVPRLERFARERPDALVLESERVRLTFAELNARANRLARALLRRADLGRDDVVALLVTRSERLLETILAVWKCGAAFVPIEPAYPPARVRDILERSRAVLALCDAAALAPGVGVLVPPDTRVATFEELGDELRSGDAADLGRVPEPDSLAYVIFTSGSTGAPKGAMIEHRGMLNHLLAKVEDLSLGPDARVVQNASHCFDICVWQLFAAPLAGGATLVYPDELVLDTPRFCERLRDDAPTVVETVPSYLRALLEQARGSALRLPALRVMIVNGEELKRPLVQAWFECFPDVPLINAYGPTECSDDVTHAWLHGVPDRASMPLGRPLRNFRLYVVDDLGRLCPLGVKGEIWISGLAVGRGYLGDPERTRAAYGLDPFRPGDVRLYRTGDLGRQLPGGELIFHGRKDTQVKLRGLRLELGEIERTLVTLDGVREAVVRKCGPDGREFLCAYVEPAEGPRPEPEALAAQLAQRLPAHMVPASWMLLDALPLNSNGKVDRGRLPDPPARGAGEAAGTPPVTDAERRLAAAWHELLGGEPPGLEDDFFERGGDSILSMRLVSLAARHGLKLSPRQIFENSVLGELARVAVPLGEAAPAAAGPEPATTELALTPIQQRFLDNYGGDSPQHYNQAVLLEVPAALDPHLLEQALAHVIAVHAALRLRFRRGPQAWTPSLAAPDAPWPLAVEQLDGGWEEALPERVEALHAALDLEQGPLARAGLFRRAPDEPARLLLVAHHLAVDAVSWPIIVGDLHAAYETLARGATPRPEPGTPWRAWTERLTAHARSDELRRELGFWLRQGDALEPLPRDRAVPPAADTVAVQHEATLALDPAGTAVLLRDLPAAYNGRSDDALLAALALTLMRWSGRRAVLIDVELHGREAFDDLDLGRSVGWFTAQFPLRIEFEHGARAGLRQALIGAKDALRAVPGHGLGYGLLRYGAAGPQPQAELAGSGQPEISFNFLGRVDAAGTAGAWRLACESSGAGRPRSQRREHPLALDAWVADGRLHFTLAGGPAHDAATLRRLAQDYHDTLARLIEHFRRPAALTFTPSDFPLAGLDQPALDALVARVASAGPGEAGTPADVYPLTPMQQGLLFHSLYAPGAEIYRNGVSARIDGALDAALFRRAWQATVERHAPLRTSFHWQDLERPLQVVHRAAELDWREHDWGTLAADEQDRRFAELVEREQSRPFALDRPPLLRVTLVHLGPRRARLHTLQHHLLFDGWSAAIVLRDVFAAYDALVAGRAFDAPAPRPFRDHVAWLARQDTAGAEAHWRRELHGLEAPTPLVLGRPELEGRAHDGAMDERQALLDADTSAALAAVAQGARVTLNALAQGAWSLLLSRLSGQDDVVHGTVVSGRPSDVAGAGEMVGVFINTVPVRARVTPETPLAQWLGRVHAAQAGREAFSYCPLAEIQGWSELPPGTPLCSSLLIFENYPVDEALRAEPGALRLHDVQAHEPNSFPLTLVVTPGRELALKIMYDAGRFDGDTAAGLLARYRSLLVQFTRAPEAPIGSFEVLSGEERRTALDEWNGTVRPLPDARSVLELFRRRAAEAPQRVAVRHAGTELSYAALDARSSALARRLREAAAPGPDARVALLLPRGPHVFTAVLAAWKCGAAYVPIEPTQPAARVAAILDEARPCALVTTAAPCPELRLDASLPVVVVGEPETEAASRPVPADDLAAFPGPAPEDLAYVIFTSGSTGRPKGVMVEQRGMLNHVLAMARAAALDEHCVVAQTASCGFDISVWQMFAPLVSGGTSAVYGSDVVLRPRDLVARLDADGVHVVQLVPSYLAALLEEVEPGGARPRALRLLSTIGEALKPSLARRWFELFPDVPLLNAYGPTEASDSVAHHLLSAAPAGPVPIGRPIANLRLYVLDESGRLCPPGVKGELYIAGLGVGRGYLFDEEGTRRAFGPDPFAPSERMYRSGDVACWSADGTLHFFGRRDHQVKLRGQRLELGEVESALADLDGVSEAVALLRPETRGEGSLCAWVVRETGREVEPRALLARLRERLPAASVPDHVLVLDAWPRTPNGKIDRRALPAPAAAAAADGSSSPRTPLEQALARAYAEVLGRGEVGLDDSFFALGGHSLKAVRLAAHVHRTLGLALDLADAVRFDNVRALAAHLAAHGRPARPPIPRAPAADAYPASHAQRRVWLASRTRAGSLAHNIVAGLLLRGPLDAGGLARALAAVVERHESLRTVFDGTGGALVQRVRPADAWGALVERRPLAPGEDLLEAAAALLRAQAATPFDLERGPLLRAVLLRGDERTHVLALALHHVACDAWSLDLLLHETAALYDGGPGALPPLALQHKDYAAWEQAQEKAGAFDAARESWLARLQGAPPPVSVSDGAEADGDAEPSGALALPFDAGRTRALETAAADCGATPHALLLAAVAGLLHRITGAEDLVLGTQSAGRAHPDLDGQVGSFVNTLPLRLRPRGELRLRAFVEQVQAELARAREHEECPFDLVAEALPARGAGALFDVQVDYLRALRREGPRPALGALELAELPGEGARSPWGLGFLIGEHAGGLHIHVAYRRTVLSDAGARRLLERLERVLAALLGETQRGLDTRLSDLAFDAPAAGTGDAVRVELEI